MSRWFVGSSRHEHVAAREEDARELDAPPLTAGQHAEREVEAVATEAETGNDRPDLGLGGVAAVGGERLLGAGENGATARSSASSSIAMRSFSMRSVLGVDPAARQDV